MTDLEVSGVGDFLAHRRDDIVALLMELVNLESPSLVPESQHAIQELLTRRLKAIGFEAQLFPGQETGGHLYLAPSGLTGEAPNGAGAAAEAGREGRGVPVQLLLGHTDTVWPIGTVYDMPVEWDEAKDVIRGPGVFDMKAGIVQMVFALEALSELGLEPTVAPTIFLNSDEEIGSPESQDHVERLAQASSRVLVLEPALGDEGFIKTTRRGVSRFDIRVVGRASHSGLALEDGASAIHEMALVIQALHAFADPERGIAVNVGTVSGGTAANVVAAECWASVDVRVATLADGRRIKDLILGLEATTPGTRLEIEVVLDRGPMELTPRNQALWEAVQGCGSRLGLKLKDAQSGGASDGNTTSLFTATVDGLGAVGHGAHARNEHVRVSELLERTTLLALILMMPDLEP
jgi:glutamate carboxypeptidase